MLVIVFFKRKNTLNIGVLNEYIKFNLNVSIYHCCKDIGTKGKTQILILVLLKLLLG